MKQISQLSYSATVAFFQPFQITAILYMFYQIDMQPSLPLKKGEETMKGQLA